MTGDILNAVIAECKALFTDTGGTVLLKTDYKASALPGYTMPLILIDLADAPDTYQYPGGASRVDWSFFLNTYEYVPNPTDDDGGYSVDLLLIIDIVRRHFAKGVWLNTASPNLTDMLNRYCFKFTLGSTEPADHIEQDGMKMGYKLTFESVGIDNDTNNVVDSTSTLTTVTQVGNPPFD